MGILRGILAMTGIVIVLGVLIHSRILDNQPDIAFRGAIVTERPALLGDETTVLDSASMILKADAEIQAAPPIAVNTLQNEGNDNAEIHLQETVEAVNITDPEAKNEEMPIEEPLETAEINDPEEIFKSVLPEDTRIQIVEHQRLEPLEAMKEIMEEYSRNKRVDE